MTISITDQPSSPKTEDSEVILSVEGVSKKFCRDLKRSLFYGVQDIASDLLGIREKSDKLREKEFWALDNVSFELRRGEALGLVGKNGSGKSTLLRIIAGLIKPDLGTVKVKGRIAPLIALGAGFNPILTGRENIYANMSILGLSKQEIDDRFDEVVEFAEIGDAIDAPVQTYSSGMHARLGFSSAIHTNPDLLIVDEVLSVGDVNFQSKCFNRIGKLRQQGTSIILVTHNLHHISRFCDRAVYLKRGQMICVDRSDEAVGRFMQDMLGDRQQEQLDGSDFEQVNGSGKVIIQKVVFLDSKQREVTSIKTGSSLILRIFYQCNVEKIKEPILDVMIKDQEGVLFQGSNDTFKQNIGILSGDGFIDVFFREYSCQ